MANPFDDTDGRFVVLVNEQGQHSLWPTFAEVPAGWTVACAECGRDEALAYVAEHWTDMRPSSLVRETAGAHS